MTNANRLHLSGVQNWLSFLTDESRKKEILEDFNGNDFTDFFGRELGLYEFEEDLGISGILLPSGHFLKCKDRQHNLLDSLLTQEEKFLSIYFSSKLFKEDYSIFSHHFLNNGASNSESIKREVYVLNAKGDRPLSEFDKKILMTSEQADFLESHYKYLNASQKDMISIGIIGELETVENFSKEQISDRYVVL